MRETCARQGLKPISVGRAVLCAPPYLCQGDAPLNKLGGGQGTARPTHVDRPTQTDPQPEPSRRGTTKYTKYAKKGGCKACSLRANLKPLFGGTIRLWKEFISFLPFV